MSPIYFVLGNIFAATVAYLAAGSFMRDREPWRKALATVAGFPVVVLFVMLVLGTAGHLSAGAAVLLTGVLASAALAIRKRAPAVQSRAAVSRESLKRHRDSDSLFSAVSVALFAGFAGAWVILSGFRGTRFGWDDLSYHAPAAAQWIVDGRLSLAPFDYHAYFPLNAELLSLWFMLPFGADALAGLSSLYWGVLFVSAGVSLVVAQGYSWAVGMFVGALLLVSPVVLLAARTFSAVDLAGPALVLAALALAAPSREKPTERADAAYSGLLAGFATGCKISFAPVVAVLLVWQLFVWRQRGQAGAQLKNAAVFAAAAATTGTYWYIRNWLLTENPVFPAALGPFDGPFGPVEQSRTKLIRWMLEGPAELGWWVSLVRKHADWPAGLSLLAVAGYGLALWGLVRRQRTSNPDHQAIQWLLVLVGTVLIFNYPFMPFSGTFDEPDGSLQISLRYLIAPFAIGIVLFAECLQRKSGLRTLWMWVALLSVASTWPSYKQNAASSVIAAAVAVGLLFGPKSTRPMIPTKALSTLRFAALPGMLLLIVSLAPYKQRLTDLEIYNAGSPQQPIGRAWREIDGLPNGSRIAWFGPASYQYYPLFGRRLQLIPTPLRSDGTSFQPLHEEFRRKRVSWWQRDLHDGDRSHLVSNLVSNGVAYVFVTKWNRDEWPQEHRVLSSSADARSIYDDGYSAIWKIGSRTGQAGGHSEDGSRSPN